MARSIAIKRAFSAGLLLLLTGCVSTLAPDNDSEFVAAPDLDAFVGCYRNCSNPHDGSTPVCLTSIIWPAQFTPETTPKVVEIRKGEGSSLIASAISDKIVLKQSRFEEGKDFQFKGGRIELKREYLASGAREPGNPFIGVATSNTVLGLDTSGQGRVSQSTAFAGTGFLIIPVAGKTSTTQRIDRAPADLCEGP